MLDGLGTAVAVVQETNNVSPLDYSSSDIPIKAKSDICIESGKPEDFCMNCINGWDHQIPRSGGWGSSVIF